MRYRKCVVKTLLLFRKANDETEMRMKTVRGKVERENAIGTQDANKYHRHKHGKY